MSTTDVLIVGGGPVGLALALKLDAAGLSVAVIEREPPPAAPLGIEARSYALSQRALEALSADADGVMTVGHGFRQLRAEDPASGQALAIDAADFGRAELGRIVGDRPLRLALHQAAITRQGIAIHSGYHADRLTVTSTRVEIDGSGGRLRASLAVAADGARSWLREAAGIASGTQAYGEQALCAVVELERPSPTCAWQRFLSSGPLALLPASETQAVLVWTLPDELAERHGSEPRALAQALEAAVGDHCGRVLDVAGLSRVPLKRGRAVKAGRDRVLLIGDALRSVHPLAGQGLNLALADVAAVSALLADGHRRGADLGSPLLLRAGGRAVASSDAAAAAIDLLHGLYGRDGLAAWRAIGLRAIAATPLLRRWIARAAGAVG